MRLRVKQAFGRAFINNTILFLRFSGTALQSQPRGLKGEFRTIEEYEPSAQYGSIICSELAKGSRAFLFVVEDGHVAHYSFVTDKKIMVGEIRRYLSPPKKSVFIYNCFTDERFRRLGIFDAMLRHIIINVPGRDKYIHVLEHNRASQLAKKKRDSKNSDAYGFAGFCLSKDVKIGQR